MGGMIAYINALQIALVQQQAEIRDLQEKLVRSAELLDESTATIYRLLGREE